MKKTIVMMMVLLSTLKSFGGEKPTLIYKEKDNGQYGRAIKNLGDTASHKRVLNANSYFMLTYQKKTSWIMMSYYTNGTHTFDAIFYKQKNDTVEVSMNKHYATISRVEANKAVTTWLQSVQPRQKVYRRKRR